MSSETDNNRDNNIEGNPLAPLPDRISSAMYSYIMTDKTLDEVSEIYGIDRRNLGKICNKEGWTRQKREMGTRLRQMVLASMVERETIKRAAAVQTRESHRIQRAIDDLDRICVAQVSTGSMTLAKFRDYAAAYSSLYTELRKALGIADKVQIQADIFALVPADERADTLKRYRQDAPEPERITASSLLIADSSVVTDADIVPDARDTPPTKGNDRGEGIDQFTPAHTPDISKPHTDFTARYSNGM